MSVLRTLSSVYKASHIELDMSEILFHLIDCTGNTRPTCFVHKPICASEDWSEKHGGHMRSYCCSIVGDCRAFRPHTQFSKASVKIRVYQDSDNFLTFWYTLVKI